MAKKATNTDLSSSSSSPEEDSYKGKAGPIKYKFLYSFVPEYLDICNHGVKSDKLKLLKGFYKKLDNVFLIEFGRSLPFYDDPPAGTYTPSQPGAVLQPIDPKLDTEEKGVLDANVEDIKTRIRTWYHNNTKQLVNGGSTKDHVRDAYKFISSLIRERPRKIAAIHHYQNKNWKSKLWELTENALKKAKSKLPPGTKVNRLAITNKVVAEEWKAESKDVRKSIEDYCKNKHAEEMKQYENPESIVVRTVEQYNAAYSNTTAIVHPYNQAISSAVGAPTVTIVFAINPENGQITLRFFHSEPFAGHIQESWSKYDPEGWKAVEKYSLNYAMKYWGGNTISTEALKERLSQALQVSSGDSASDTVSHTAPSTNTSKNGSRSLLDTPGLFRLSPTPENEHSDLSPSAIAYASSAASPSTIDRLSTASAAFVAATILPDTSNANSVNDSISLSPIVEPYPLNGIGVLDPALVTAAITSPATALSLSPSASTPLPPVNSANDSISIPPVVEACPSNGTGSLGPIPPTATIVPAVVAGPSDGAMQLNEVRPTVTIAPSAPASSPLPSAPTPLPPVAASAPDFSSSAGYMAVNPSWPNYVKKANEGLFGAQCLGADFQSLFMKWLAYEEASGFVNMAATKSLIQGRPKELSEWITQLRPNIPVKPKAKFTQQLIKWWKGTQPPGRVINGNLVRGSRKYEWDKSGIQRSGANGVLLYVVCIAWLGIDISARGGPALADEHAQWHELVVDMEWAIDCLIKYTNSPQTRKRTSDSEPSRKSKRQETASAGSEPTRKSKRQKTA